MIRFILIIAIGIAAWIIYHFARQSVKKHGRGYLIKIALFVLAAIILLAVVTGKAPALFALVAAIVPFIGRLAPVLRFWPLARQLYNQYRSQNPAAGNHSNVRTAWLAMTLDHDSGEIDGEILGGSFAGRLLSALTIAELQQFYTDCTQHDPETLRLLEAYAQRERAGEWEPRVDSEGGGEGDSEGGSEQRAESPATMHNADAWEILGLQPGASRKEIIATHRRLMSKLHPDKGGSNYLAGQINRAKDLLLKTIDK